MKASTVYKYNTTLLKGQSDYIGKVILDFDKSFRASYLKAESHIDNISIVEILGHKKSIDEFPGFNNVKISYEELSTIFKLREESWLGALANIKGVYLITDLKGKCHYVGSATGSEGIWSRWQSYVKNGLGNNTELRSLLKKHPKRSNSFQFSILEIADNHTSDKEIIKRETHWKDVLGSRLFGYNSN